MRRISLALALVGAIAVSGCGRGSSSGSSGSKGANSNTFNVNINQPPIGGSISTADKAINCGITKLGALQTNAAGDLVTGTPTYITGSATCPASTSYAIGTSVVVTATATTGFTFVGWAGDCTPANSSGATCTLTGPGDKTPIAIFSSGTAGHGNFLASTVHGPAYEAFKAGTAGALQCTSCHGATLHGQGIAPDCANCHLAALKVKAGEQCGVCHKDSGDRHQALYDSFTDASKLVATIGSVTSTPVGDGTYNVAVTFTLTKNGAAYSPAPSALAQKTVYAAPFNKATGKVGTTFSLTLGSPVNGVYTATKSGAPFAPESSDSFVYAYFAENPTLWPNNKNYKIYDNVASVAQQFNADSAAPWAYTSTANVEGCQKCHPTPYMKHGYRAARVAGIPDFMACKACHYDTRPGEDFVFQLTYDAFPLLTSISPQTAGVFPPTFGDPAYTPDIESQYAYYASVMQDTHQAHSGEIKYPQAMANCVTCHEGKLDRVLTDANFNGFVCKSCHPTTSPTDGAAPSFANTTTGLKLGLALGYHKFDWSDGTVVESDGSKMQCFECHYQGNTVYGHAPTFAEIHNGYDKAIYSAANVKYADTVTSKIDSLSYDKTAKKLTVQFSMTGVPTGATVAPTIEGSVYGYGTKDFTQSGHANAADGKRVLEWSGTNTARLTVTGTGPWVAVMNLSDATAFPTVADGTSKAMEVGFLPAVKLADGTAVAASGLTATVDLTVDGAGTPVANQYGKGIVDPAKCNNCHGALGLTFHSPSYGSAGVVGCRLCHWVGSGSSHLEMQSRSIDSFVHAIHSFQYMDIAGVNFADKATALEYSDHIEATYPMFTTLNCKSCHYDNVFNAPDQTKSLPGIQSASANVTTATRAITGVPSVVTGPGSRACGGCHRAELIKEDNAAGLSAFDSHVGATFGYRDVPTGTDTTTTLLKAWIAKIFN